MGHRIGQWRAGGVDWYIMLNGRQWQHIRPCMAGGRRLVHGFRQQRIGRRWMGQQANCSEKVGIRNFIVFKMCVCANYLKYEQVCSIISLLFRKKRTFGTVTPGSLGRNTP